MKKLLAILLALLVLLAGCTMPGTVGTDAAAETKNDAAISTEATTGGEESSDAALAEENRYLGGYEYRTARIGDVLYFTDYGAPNVPMLLALDLNTGETFPLCARPECEHNSTACGAYAGAFGSPVQLTAWRGQLYFLDHVLPHNSLYRIDADGSNRIKVMELNDLSNPERGSADTWFGIYDGMFYQCVYGQYVEDADVEGTAVLYRQPLESGSAERAEELLRVDGAAHIDAAMDGSTLYCAVYVYEEDPDTNRLTVYACDLEDGEVTEFWQGDIQADFRNLIVQDGELLFGTTTSPFAISLTDKSVTELPMTGYATLLGDGVSLILPNPDKDGEHAEQCRIVDRAGNVLYEGRYFPERYKNVNSRASLEAKYVMLKFAGYSGGRFCFHLFYMEYGRYEYALLVFDTETFSYATPYILDWPHEEYHGTFTIEDDDGNVRVYDSVTGKQISGPPEETTGED